MFLYIVHILKDSSPVRAFCIFKHNRSGPHQTLTMARLYCFSDSKQVRKRRPWRKTEVQNILIALASSRLVDSLKRRGKEQERIWTLSPNNTSIYIVGKSTGALWLEGGKGPKRGWWEAPREYIGPTDDVVDVLSLSLSCRRYRFVRRSVGRSPALPVLRIIV